MAVFELAHVHEQGVDLIIVPLTQSFGNKTQQEQNEIAAGLQLSARGAGLAGTVVPVWDSGSGRMAFLAPQPYHAFFQSIGLRDVASWINKTLTVG